MGQRRLAQIVEDLAIEPRRRARAKKVGRGAVVEDKLMRARTEQDPRRHVRQERLQPGLLALELPGLALHGGGERRPRLGERGGHRRRRRPEIAKIARGAGIEGPRAVGMGLGTQSRRQPVERAAHVLVEQKPDPGDDTEKRETRHRADKDEIRQRFRQSQPVIADPEPRHQRRDPAHRDGGEEQQEPLAQAQPVKHRLPPPVREAAAPRRAVPSARRAWR